MNHAQEIIHIRETLNTLRQQMNELKETLVDRENQLLNDMEEKGLEKFVFDNITFFAKTKSKKITLSKEDKIKQWVENLQNKGYSRITESDLKACLDNLDQEEELVPTLKIKNKN